MTEHPTSAELEAVAAGDSNAEVEAHVDECEACREYLEVLWEELSDWRQSPERERGLQRLKQAQAPSGGTLIRVARWGSIAAAPLLVAAAVMLFMRRPPPPVPGGPDPSVAPALGGTRFKGPPQVAVIVEHLGEQRRTTDQVEVSAGDALRVEVSLADARPISAGVLTKDRQYVPLLLPAELDAGTHFSEKAAHFDAEPTEGWVIVGEPDAVRRAQQTGDLSGVTALPLRYTRAP